jgi:hypothetical protein
MTGAAASPSLAPTCSRCLHGAESHMHGDPLSCAHCCLTPLSHVHGLACALYAPRMAPRSGASCRVPGCECEGGYCPRKDEER